MKTYYEEEKKAGEISTLIPGATLGDGPYWEGNDLELQSALFDSLSIQ